MLVQFSDQLSVQMTSQAADRNQFAVQSHAQMAALSSVLQRLKELHPATPPGRSRSSNVFFSIHILSSEPTRFPSKSVLSASPECSRHPRSPRCVSSFCCAPARSSPTCSRAYATDCASARVPVGNPFLCWVVCATDCDTTGSFFSSSSTRPLSRHTARIARSARAPHVECFVTEWGGEPSFGSLDSNSSCFPRYLFNLFIFMHNTRRACHVLRALWWCRLECSQAPHPRYPCQRCQQSRAQLCSHSPRVSSSRLRLCRQLLKSERLPRRTLTMYSSLERRSHALNLLLKSEHFSSCAFSQFS